MTTESRAARRPSDAARHLAHPAVRLALAWVASYVTGAVLVAWSVDAAGAAQGALVLASSLLPAAVAVLCLTGAQVAAGIRPALLAALPPEALRLALLLPAAAARDVPTTALVVSAAVALLCAVLGALGTRAVRTLGAAPGTEAAS